MQTKKFLQRVAIMLLIAVFSIAGIISCAADATDPSASQTDSGNTGEGIPEPDPSWKPDDSGSNNPDTDNPEPEQPSFDEDSYKTIYAPFVDWEDKSKVPEANKIIVSWNDANSLTKIWKKQIEGGKDNDGKRFIIRDANNNQSDPLTGSYYYFDKDFNIVYYRQGKGSLLVRKFIKGTMINYSGHNGTKPAGDWGIGGVYETVLTKKEITDNNFDQLNIFMGDRDMGEERGNLEVLTINTGYTFDNNSEFGVTFYYAKNNKEEYTTNNPVTGVRNLSWDPGYVNFKFVSAKPENWHLTEHINQQGWH